MPDFSKFEALLKGEVEQEKATERSAFLTPEQKAVTDRGVVGTVLDYVNRGYAGSIGALTSMQEGTDPVEGWLKGIRGEEHKSMYDVIVNMGAPPDSTATHVGGMALDLFPGAVLDPLTYATFGLNKVGMLGKAASEVGRVGGALPEAGQLIDAANVMKDAVIPMRLVADPISVGLERYAVDFVEAAKRGAWSPLNVLGKSVVPRAVAEPVARLRQLVGDTLTGTVTTETMAGRTGKTVADEIGLFTKAVSSPYRTGAKYLGGRKKKFGDVWQGFVASKRELGEQAGADLTKIGEQIANADTETQALVTHMIENPGLAQALNEGRKMRIAVPRSMTEEDVRQFADQLLPFMKVNQNAKEAYNTSFKAGLWGLRDAVDAATPREYSAMTMTELRRLAPNQDLESMLKLQDPIGGIYAEPITGDAMVKALIGPDAAFEGLAPIGMAGKDARDTVHNMLRREKKTGQRFGHKSVDDLLQGQNDAVVLFSRGGVQGKVDDALAGRIRGIGGWSRDWVERKQTIEKYVDGMMDYRGDLMDKEAVRKAVGAPKNSKTFDTIWETVNDTVWMRQPGDHSDYADKMVKWGLVKLTGDPVAEWKVKQGLINEEIQKRIIQLDTLSKDVPVPGDPVDVVKQAKQIEINQELDGLRDELRDVDKFGKAQYFKGLMNQKKRPVLKQPTVMKEIDPNRWTPAQITRAQEIYNATAPIRKNIFDLYTKRGVEPPDTLTYMQHILQGQVKGGWNPAKQAANLAGHDERVKAALYTNIAMQNPTLRNSDILQRVDIEMAGLRSQFGARVSDGRFDPLIFKRKWPFTILQMREGGIGPVFEENFGRLTGEQYRIASNWAYGHDAYKSLITEHAGKYAKQFASPADAPRGWVKIDYHVPFLKEGQKSPFDGWYIPKELDESMRRGIHAAAYFSSEDGMNALIKSMHTFRRYWASWTLAPFPAFHARNAVSNFMLNYIGHLNPITSSGARAYGAAMGIRGEQHLQSGFESYVRDQVWTRGKQLTVPELKTILKDQGVDGIVQRDLDWVERGTQIIAEIKKDPENKTGWIERIFNSDLHTQTEVADALAQGKTTNQILAFFNPKPETNPIIRVGFKTGQEIESYFRTALFLHRMEETAGHVTDWDKAVEDATYWVNKHLYDYGDLSPTEQKIKAFVPFYTWSRSNIPHMLETLVTEPNRVTYLNRALQGGWNGFDKEVEDTDLPKWMQEDMGVPIGTFKNAEGKTEYKVWLPTGWLPMTELNEFATSFRGRDSFARFWLSKMTPLLKEGFEQAMDRDTFFYEELSKNGQQANMLGIINGPAWAIHILQNVRLITALNEVNPGGLFTWLGQKAGYFKGERPHRHDAPELDRWMKQLTGFNVKTVQPDEEVRRKVQTLNREISELKGSAHRSMRDGYTSELESRLTEMRDKRDERLVLLNRLVVGGQARIAKQQEIPK